MEIGRTERLIACSDNYSFVQYSSYIRGGGQFQRKYFGRGAWYKNEGLTDLSERKVFTRRRRGAFANHSTRSHSPTPACSRKSANQQPSSLFGLAAAPLLTCTVCRRGPQRFGKWLSRAVPKS